MDPLSALRTVLPPTMPGRVAAPGGAEAAGARTISPAELGQLQPGFAITEPGKTAAPTSFEQVFDRMVGEVNAKQGEAAETVQALLSGQQVQLHEAMVALEEASLSFQLMVEVRNKLLESYQELMRMQV